MVEKNDSPGKKLQEMLERKAIIGWDKVKGTPQWDEVFRLGEDYKDFLNQAKTEREAVNAISQRALASGFVPWEELEGKEFAPGTKFVRTFRGKAVVLGICGRDPLSAGLRLVGAHIDSPRLDLKPNPLYEGGNLALLKTHYYGGIKKYQWPVMPLALHGVVILADSRRIELALGEKEDDPVFTITDLLPHLGKEQAEKKLKEAIEGECLNVLAGHIPYAGDEEIKDRVKLAVLDYLHRQYGLIEEDFLTAEIEVVPAGKARDVGLDRSMVGAYGQDDRVCAYAMLHAILGMAAPRHTALAFFADKEEIGSMGNTGAQGPIPLQMVADLNRLTLGDDSPSSLRQVFAASAALSADVDGALDPTFESVMDKLNAARLGGGVVLTKYTGSGGKFGANDAHAEYLARLRRLFNREGIVWQIGELGKVDQGGGGTIAQFLANLGLEVVDCGVAVLSMHSPFEVTSKVDIYYTSRAYQAFWQAEKLGE